jgi:predicted AAA+ superfamily ATPase
MIKRIIEKELETKLFRKKVILLLGGRQVGKSTLLRKITQNREDTLWLNADEPDIRSLLENSGSTRLKSYFGKNKLIILDEAQLIPDIGRKLKLMADSLPDVQVIATGSSAFEIRNASNEPLTGRKWEYQLFPLSFSEMADELGLIEEKRMLPHRLIYGYYPEIVTHPGEERERLRLLSESFLYKDILMHLGLKKPEKLIYLLKLLAFYLGSEISYNKLSRETGLNHETVEKYIQLLEQCYVVFRLPSFSGNLAKELRKSRKIYFTDNGIINSLTGNFAIIENRQDAGALWENFVVNELRKVNEYVKQYGEFYFWRTHDQQEIDLIIKKDAMLQAYEIKWNPKAKARLSKTFSSNYPEHSFAVITPDNPEDYFIPSGFPSYG